MINWYDHFNYTIYKNTLAITNKIITILSDYFLLKIMSNIAVTINDDWVTLYTDSHYRFYAIDIICDRLGTYKDLWFVWFWNPNVISSALLCAKQFYKWKLDNELKRVMFEFLKVTTGNFCLLMTDWKELEKVSERNDYINAKNWPVFEWSNSVEAKAHYEAYIDMNKWKIEEWVYYALSKASPKWKVEKLYISKS